jgi:hypothetical protein
VLRDNADNIDRPNPAVAVGVEADDAGNVDDAVLYRLMPPHTYSQVKWTANGETPIGTEFLTEKKAESGTSLLAKFVDAHQRLTEQGDPVDMVLRTNRNIDTASVLLTGIDPRTQLLLPRAAEQTSASTRGKERAAWAAGAGVSEDHLLQLLEVLRFETGYNVNLLRDNVSNLMTATGLRSDEPAILTATSWVQEQVVNGVKRIDLDAIRSAVVDLGLSAGHAWPTVSIATLTPDPLADQAVHALDWVDRFDGDDAYMRRRPAEPSTWEQLADDIAGLPGYLTGLDAVLVTGSLRLATGFAVGAALRKVTGIEVAWKQGSQLWRSDHPYDEPLAPKVSSLDLSQGDEIAIVVDIATTATPDVVDWLKQTDAPVGTVLTVSPATGTPKDNAIPDAATALALAVGIRDVARRAARKTVHLHLFQAGPLGLALLLGHRWNRVVTTSVYEDLGPQGYELAFTVSA